MPWQAHFWHAGMTARGDCRTRGWEPLWRQPLFPGNGSPPVRAVRSTRRRALELCSGRKSALTLHASSFQSSFTAIDGFSRYSVGMAEDLRTLTRRAVVNDVVT